MRNRDLQILIDRDRMGRYTVSAHEPGSTVVTGHFGTLDHAKKAAKKLRKATSKGQDKAPIKVLDPTTLGYIFHE